MNSKEKYEVKKISDLKFDTEVHASKLILRFENVSKNYGSKQIFSDLNFEVRGKEKVWLFGPNGAGKSTIVKILVGEEKPTEGTITLGDKVKVGYYSQLEANLNSDLEILEYFIKETGCYFGDAFGYLKKFLFDKETVKKKVSYLSPGERARLAFAIFAHKDYDLLILDEPDNHLDIETKEVLERSLNEFDGTIFLVSHDRYFVESVGITKVLNLRDGKVEEC